MSIDIKVDGKPVWTAGTYSVVEDSTPLDPGDTSGGYGQFTIGIRDSGVGVQRMRGKTIDLADGAQGKTQGIIRGLTSDGSTATLTGDSRLSALNVIRTAQPYTGTLGGAFTYYLSLVGITSGIVIDSTITGRSVTFPGWNGNCWDQVRKVAAAQQVEVTLASNNIVMRPLRGRIAQNYRDSAVSWTVDDTQIAQSVQICYYNSTQKTNALAYPLGGWQTDTPVQQGLAAGSVTEVDIPLLPSDTSTLGASLTSVQQPIAVDSVAKDYAAASVYSIVGNDGLPYTAAEWNANGGSVSVAIGDDTRSLKLTITASSETQYAPYQLAMSSGPSDSYSSLRIVGTGVFYDRQTLTLQTGNSADRAPQEVGEVVDDEFINTRDEAVRAGQWTLARWTGPQRTISVATTGINRRGDTGSYTYPTMGEANVDPDFAGKTMGQINAAFAGYSFGQFSDYEFAKVANDFTNQAFGNVAGARVLHQGQWYRIRNVSDMGPAGVSYTAECDTVFGDASDAYAGMTMGQMNALLGAGLTMGDFSSAPLPIAS